MRNEYEPRPAAFEDVCARHRFLPVRIVKTWGGVQGAQALLCDQPAQAYLGDFHGCVLKNAPGAQNAALLVDFGREYCASACISTLLIDGGVRFAPLRVRFGESASEAIAPLTFKNAGNDHAARDQVLEMSALSARETNESGFRFVYIELLGEHEVQLLSVRMTAVYRDLVPVGAFECDDPRVNRIWKTAAHTVHMCMQDLLWDGVKRDRLVWMGDMHTEVLSILALYGANGIVPASLDFLKARTPEGGWMNGMPSYSLWWALVNRDWYLHAGDRAYLLAQKPYLTALSSRLLALVKEDGGENMPGKFLDWPTSDDPIASHEGMQGLLCLALRAAGEMLSAMDEPALSSQCLCAAKRMKAHLPAPSESKSAAAILSLSGIANARDINRERLAPGGARGYSCFMGGYILQAKALAGDLPGALNDLRAYWGGMLEMGATTFWEDFSLDWMPGSAPIDEPVPDGMKDIHGDFGAYCYKGFRHSLCHGWSAGPIPFLSRDVLGVRPLAPGYQKVEIRPALGDLRFARGCVPTPLGILRVTHETASNGGVRTQIHAPEGMEIVR